MRFALRNGSKKPKEEWNTYVLRQHQLGRCQLDPEAHNLGPAYTETGKTVYWVEKTAVGYTPLSRKRDKNTVSPGKLYRALVWKPRVRQVYYPIPPFWERLNAGLMFALVAILLFFVYLIFANAGG